MLRQFALAAGLIFFPPLIAAWLNMSDLAWRVLHLALLGPFLYVMMTTTEELDEKLQQIGRIFSHGRYCRDNTNNHSKRADTNHRPTLRRIK